MVNGKAVNVFRAPKSENTVHTMISAVVVEADNQDMIGLSAVTSITLLADADSGKNGPNAGSTVNRDAAVLYVNALDTARVKIEFSGAIKNVSKDNFNISNGVIVVDVQLSDDGKSVTLLIEGAEYANTYTVSVQGLEQKNGGGVQESVLSFTIPSKSNENTQSDAPEADVSKPQGSTSTKAQKITYQTDAVKNGRAEYGTKFFLNAKASGKGKLSYKSSDSKVLSVDASGKVTVKKYGHASITIKAASGNGYKAAQKIIKLMVVPKQVRITKAQWKKDNKAYFEWKQDKSADGYEYSFAYNPEFDSEIKGESVGKQNHITMGNFKGLEKGGIYIRVRAFKKVDGNRYYSAWSDFRYLAL